jgi:hypothetical protein
MHPIHAPPIHAPYTCTLYSKGSLLTSPVALFEESQGGGRGVEPGGGEATRIQAKSKLSKSKLSSMLSSI